MEEKLRKYAQVLIRNGINLQKNQVLYLNCPVEAYDFCRIVHEEAYLAGAKRVDIDWYDSKSDHLKYSYASSEVFEHFEQWQQDKFYSYLDQDVAFITIIQPSFEDYSNIDSNKIIKYQTLKAQKISKLIEKQMNYENQWCGIALPNQEWAEKIFPDLSKEEALDKLWETVFDLCRVNTKNPINAWINHDNNLKDKVKLLDQYQFKALHYKNSLGTDLHIGLPLNHIWKGGSKTTPQGIDFIPNIPTEEVFTIPNRYQVNGVVYGSLPLVHQGVIIDQFKIVFKDGKAIETTAKSGEEILKQMLKIDQGASYLGEVALVPVKSPISKTGLLFYTTLYDENASCHLAFGQAYNCLSDYDKLTKEELEQRGKNESNIHVDFMIGTKDLSIKGITKDNQEIDVFINGEWAI